MSLANTGERQIASELNGIASDHKARYVFATVIIPKLFDKDELFEIGDMGCGVGYGSYILSNISLSIINSCDISDDAIMFANERYKKENISYTSKDIIEYLNEYSRNFHVVTAFEIIEHVENDLEVLRSIANKTEYIICSVPNQDVVPFSTLTHPFHVKHYTRVEFKNLLEKAGFKNVVMHTQYDKSEGIVYDGDDGRTLIAIAEVAK